MGSVLWKNALFNTRRRKLQDVFSLLLVVSVVLVVCVCGGGRVGVMGAEPPRHSTLGYRSGDENDSNNNNDMSHPKHQQHHHYHNHHNHHHHHDQHHHYHSTPPTTRGQSLSPHSPKGQYLVPHSGEGLASDPVSEDSSVLPVRDGTNSDRKTGDGTGKLEGDVERGLRSVASVSPKPGPKDIINSVVVQGEFGKDISREINKTSEYLIEFMYNTSVLQVCRNWKESLPINRRILFIDSNILIQVC